MLNVRISERLKNMPESKMTMYFNLAADVMKLGVGEPGFPTPESICQGGIDAIENGCTFYPPSTGYPELKEEISLYLKDSFGYDYDEKEILVTMGASLGLDCIIRAFINEGDEVIIPSPLYGYYASLTGLNGGTPVYAQTFEKDGWVLKPDSLKKCITPKSRMLILNYPNNPTGAVMSDEDYAALAEVIRDTDILVVSDEIYAEVLYEGKHASILGQPGMRERTFLVSGFSKNMAMTGWRLGYLCASPALLKPVDLVNAAVTLTASGISQYAALSGLRNGSADRKMMVDAYHERRDYMIGRLEKCGWKCLVPKGGFYIWADISSTGLTAEELSHRLIDEAKVAVVHGTVYGDSYSDYVRITFTADMSYLKEAADRIDKWILSHKKTSY